MTLNHVELLAAERRRPILEKLLFLSISFLNNHFMSSFSWGEAAWQEKGVGKPQKVGKFPLYSDFPTADTRCIVGKFTSCFSTT